MAAVIREIAIAADVFAIARALADRPGLAVLASDARGALRTTDARVSFVACDPTATSHDLLPPREDAPREQAGWAGAGAGPRWIGAIPYEAMRGIERGSLETDVRALPWMSRPTWNRYAAVVRIDHATGCVVVEADSAEECVRLERALRRTQESRAFALEPLALEEAEGAHLERIRAALRLIAAGDIYQVNLARRIPFDFQGDPLALFISLMKRAPAPYGFYADLGAIAVVASSPELALEVRGDALRTAPIKGTRPRGGDAAHDRALSAELDADPKERAELTMAIDLHRNDLGRVAATGSVRVLGEPRVVRARTVWSRVAEVVARRAPGVTDEAIVRAMLPCGSVTGAPKIRAMEVIAALEPFRRGLYTGAFGYVGRDGALVLAMAIRTLEVEGRERAAYFSGGGIVADSVPERELEETKWKATQLAGL